MKKIILSLFLVLLVSALGLFVVSLPKIKEANATGQGLIPLHTDWTRYGDWSEWGECQTRDTLTCGEGFQVGFQSRTRTRTCVIRPGEGINRCGLGETDTDTDYRVCRVQKPECIEDQCDNLEDVQETVPEGYVQEKTEEGLVCTPNRVICNDPAGANYETLDEGEVVDNTTCTPLPPVSHDGPVGSPVCTDGKVLSLPLNVLVIRNGAEATVKWIPTGGNLVNIYVLDGKGELVGAEGDVPNDGVEVIEHLNPTADYSFELEQHQGCSSGERVRVGVIDSYLPMVFYSSYWKWSN